LLKRRANVERIEHIHLGQNEVEKRKRRKGCSEDITFAQNANNSCRFDATLAILVSVFRNIQAFDQKDVTSSLFCFVLFCFVFFCFREKKKKIFI